MLYICPMGSECGRDECFARKAHDPVIMDGEPINGAIVCPCDRPRLVKVDVGIVEAAFETYEKEVIPESAGPVQRTESKQAFFGGASIMLVVLLDAILEDGERRNVEEIIDRLVGFVALLRAETTAFADSVVKRGHDGSDKNSV